MHTCMHTKKAQDVFYGDFLRLLASSGVKRVPPGSEQAVCSALSERLWKLSAHWAYIISLIFLWCLLLSCPWFLTLFSSDTLTFQKAMAWGWSSTGEITSFLMSKHCKLMNAGCSPCSPPLRFIPACGARRLSWVSLPLSLLETLLTNWSAH